MDDTFFRLQAAGLVHHRLNVLCSLGELGDCQRFSAFKSIGYPVLLALMSSATGFTDQATVLLGTMAGLATVSCVYLIMRMLDRSHIEGLGAALVLALLPMHVRYATVTMSEVLSVLTECLAVSGALLHVRTGRRSGAWLAAAAFALHVTFRVENPLALVPLAVVYAWGMRRYGVYPAPLPWLLAAVFLVPHFSDFGEFLYGGLPLTRRISLQSIPHNARYITYWIDGFHQPFLFTALALLGAAAVSRGAGPMGALVALWFASRVGLHVVHTFSGFVPRYMLPASVPFALLCGVGAHILSPSVAVVVAAVTLSGLAHLPFAYAPFYGIELEPGARSVLAAVHLALPLALLAGTSWRADGAYRRWLVAMGLAGIVLVNVLYPAVFTADGVPRNISGAYELEMNIIEQWRPLVGRECYIVCESPIETAYAWGRRVVIDQKGVIPEGDNVVPDAVPRLRTDITGLLADGECLYYYERVYSGTPRTAAMVHDSFRLERIAGEGVMSESADGPTDFKELALWRIVAPRGP